LPRLLAIGFRSLSVAPPLIPTIKDHIRSMHLSDERPAAIAIRADR